MTRRRALDPDEPIPGQLALPLTPEHPPLPDPIDVDTDDDLEDRP